MCGGPRPPVPDRVGVPRASATESACLASCEPEKGIQRRALRSTHASGLRRSIRTLDNATRINKLTRRPTPRDAHAPRAPGTLLALQRDGRSRSLNSLRPQPRPQVPRAGW